MKNRVTVIKVLEAIIKTYGLSGEVKACVEQAQKDVLTMDKLQKKPFMINALEGKE